MIDLNAENTEEMVNSENLLEPLFLAVRRCTCLISSVMLQSFQISLKILPILCTERQLWRS